jgi:PAS domain S-box-containing protein
MPENHKNKKAANNEETSNIPDSVSIQELKAEIERLKESEQKLRQSELAYRTIIENANEGIWIADTEAKTTYVNRKMADMLGYEPGEIIGKSAFHFMDEEAKALATENLNRRKKGIGDTYEQKYKRKDGSTLWASVHTSPIRDINGRIAALLGVLLDITERKRSELVLQKALVEADLNRNQLMASFQAIQDGVTIFNMAAEAVLVNEAEARIFGFVSIEDMMHNVGFFNSAYELYHLDGRPLPVDLWPVNQILSGKSIYDWQLRGRRTDTGREWVFSFSGKPIYDNSGKQILALVVTRDITESKLSEQKLVDARLEAEQRANEAEEGKSILEALMEYVPEGITIADAPDLKLRMVSRQGRELMGEDHEGLKVEEAAALWKVYDKDGLTPLPDKDLPLVRAIKEGEVVRNQEIVQVNSEGKRLYLLCNASPIRGRKGKITGGIVAWREISEIKKAESKLKESQMRLKESEERFRLALNYSPVIVFTQDKSLRYTWIHQSVLDMPNENFIGKTDFEIFAFQDADKLMKIKRNVIDTGEPAREKVSFTINGKEYYLDMSVEPLYNDYGEVDGIAGASVNITDLVLLEAEKNRQEVSGLIEKSARLASIGVIAGGITHEINQPLNAIRMGAGGILFWNRRNNNVLPAILVEMITGINDAVTRIDEIIKSMRALWANTSDDVLEVVNVNQVIEKVLTFNNQKLSNHGIHLIKRLNSGDLSIKVNELRLELVFSNLINNAVYALDNSLAYEKYLIITTFVEKGKVVVLVEDNGSGLPDISEDKLFDPFFTTKSPNEGSGLGLAIAKMFLEKYGAAINATNNKSGGATFRICFEKVGD